MILSTMMMTMTMVWCHLNDPVSLFDPGRICGRLGVNVSNQLTLLEIIVSHLFHDVVVVMAMSIWNVDNDSQLTIPRFYSCGD